MAFSVRPARTYARPSVTNGRLEVQNYHNNSVAYSMYSQPSNRLWSNKVL